MIEIGKAGWFTQVRDNGGYIAQFRISRDSRNWGCSLTPLDCADNPDEHKDSPTAQEDAENKPSACGGDYPDKACY